MTKQTFDPFEKRAVLSMFKNVTGIGAWVIGLSWPALFLVNDLKVTLNDPRTDIKEETLEGLEEIIPSSKALDYNTKGLTRNLTFEKDLVKAIQNADVIKESGQKDIAFKQDLYVHAEASTKPMVLVLSSSSGFPTTYKITV